MVKMIEIEYRTNRAAWYYECLIKNVASKSSWCLLTGLWETSVLANKKDVSTEWLKPGRRDF